jgi:Reverse transcriptase (RNA-dependent DNA polymerase)/Endonuclease-reverse transcriptase
MTLVIPGYSVLRQDRVDGLHGGVCIIYASSLNISLLNSVSMNGCETILCSLSTKSNLLCICIAYRPPNATFASSKQLFDFINTNISTYPNYIIMGDFNFPHINWKNLSGQQETDTLFLDFVADINANQLISEPTRGFSVLDLLLVSDDHAVNGVTIEPPFGNSDHNSVACSVWFPSHRAFPSDTTNNKHLFHNADYDLIREFLLTDPFAPMYELSQNDPACLWAFFKNCLTNIFNEFIPLRPTSLSKRRRPPWFSSHTIHLSNVKKRVWQKLKLRPNDLTLKEKYSEACESLKMACTFAKLGYEKQLFFNKSANPRKFYKHINAAKSSPPCLSNLTTDDGVTHTDHHDIANIMNDYFVSVFTTDNCTLPNCALLETYPEFNSFHINDNDVLNAIKGLKANAASGPDDIPAAFIKQLACFFVKPLKFLFRSFLSGGYCPPDWKIAHVVPIPKKNFTNIPSNFRPISLTSVFSKIFEKIVHQKISEHACKYKIIPSSQFGFLKGKSTCDNLLSFLHNCFVNVENNIGTDVIYLDFSKAFDSVSHEKLLLKLSTVGFGGEILAWLRSFLVGRVQCVSCSGHLSNTSVVTSGVPQGSILGPLLFLLYIHDMPNVISPGTSILFYADDCKVFRPIFNNTDRVTLQNDLNQLLIWSSDWQLPFNVKKCCVLNVGSHSIAHEYFINNLPLNITYNICDLGLTYDSKLCFDEHINILVKKAKSVSYFITSCFVGHEANFYVNLFKTYVRPIVETNCLLWCPWKIYLIDAIESVQRRFTKRVFYMCFPGTNVTYCERLHVLNLQSLEERRYIVDCTYLFNILHSNNVSVLHSYFVSSGGLRHQLDIKRHMITNSHFFHFWSNRVIRLWNSVDVCIRELHSFPLFKSNIASFARSLCVGSALR